ncbi:MAG: Nif3-like dinuclear metal center hexameric protein [Clostridiales bacterium]|nr:Nif3-like dinuclear metal center hexameric protein [Clostridiales bacterium]
MKCTVNDILSFIDSFAPFNTQAQWDNSGLLIGKGENEVNKIAVCLDITTGNVEKANAEGCDLIVSHHPVIFHPLKAIDFLSPSALLIKYGISAICVHTPLDLANGGVNDVLAGKLGLENINQLTDDGESAICRTGYISETQPEQFAKAVAGRLNTAVKYNRGGRKITKVCVCGGAGACFLETAVGCGCDALVTADVKHHEYIMASENNVTIIDAGHFETENPVIFELQKRLKKEFGIEVIAIEDEKMPEVTGGENAV